MTKKRTPIADILLEEDLENRDPSHAAEQKAASIKIVRGLGLSDSQIETMLGVKIKPKKPAPRRGRARGEEPHRT